MQMYSFMSLWDIIQILDKSLGFQKCLPWYRNPKPINQYHLNHQLFTTTLISPFFMYHMFIGTKKISVLWSPTFSSPIVIPPLFSNNVVYATWRSRFIVRGRTRLFGNFQQCLYPEILKAQVRNQWMCLEICRDGHIQQASWAVGRDLGATSQFLSSIPLFAYAFFPTGVDF